MRFIAWEDARICCELLLLGVIYIQFKCLDHLAWGLFEMICLFLNGLQVVKSFHLNKKNKKFNDHIKI